MKSRLLNQIAGQFRGNPRLQWGGLLAGLLCAGLALQALDQWRVRQQARSVDIEVETRKVIALRKQGAWIERAEQAEKLQKQLQARIPVVASPGIAQATLQTSLRMAANGITGMKGLGIDVSEPVEIEGRPGLYRVRAALRAEISPWRAFGLISAIESNPNLTVIEGSMIRSGEGQQVTINVAAFYQTSADATDADEASGSSP